MVRHGRILQLQLVYIGGLRDGGFRERKSLEIAMTYHTKAVYRGGVFFPETQCALPDEARVDLFVQGPLIVPPSAASPDERRQILQRLTRRMKQNPIPAEAPRPTRDQLHERR